MLQQKTGWADLFTGQELKLQMPAKKGGVFGCLLGTNIVKIFGAG